MIVLATYAIGALVIITICVGFVLGFLMVLSCAAALYERAKQDAGLDE